MVYSLHRAVNNALADTSDEPGLCLKQVRIWYGLPARYTSAASAWQRAKLRIKDDRIPPRGAPVFWTGGSKGFGHIALSLGNGRIRSTDVAGSGGVGTVSIDFPAQHWGLHYAGWTADLNAVVIPDLVELYVERSWGAGDVYLDKLHFGQRDSDSVRRLQRVLNGIKLPDAGKPRLPITGNYLEMTDAAVRAWQAFAGDEPDPIHKSMVHPDQADQLFAQPPYRIRQLSYRRQESAARG
jgi:hypothetical protein